MLPPLFFSFLRFLLSSSSTIVDSMSPSPAPPHSSPMHRPMSPASVSASQDLSGKVSVSSQWDAMGARERMATSRASARREA